MWNYRGKKQGKGLSCPVTSVSMQSFLKAIGTNNWNQGVWSDTPRFTKLVMNPFLTNWCETNYVYRNNYLSPTVKGSVIVWGSFSLKWETYQIALHIFFCWKKQNILNQDSVSPTKHWKGVELLFFLFLQMYKNGSPNTSDFFYQANNQGWFYFVRHITLAYLHFHSAAEIVYAGS